MSRGRHLVGLVVGMVLAVSGLIAVTPAVPALAAAAPSIESVAPAAGKTAGGTVVTLTGTGLSGVSRVVFGSRAGTKIKLVSDTPAHGGGAEGHRDRAGERDQPGWHQPRR